MLDSRVRSDDLARLRTFIAGNSQLAQIVSVPCQIRLVIDTNIVLADLLWLARERKDPTARTALQEVIASGTVIAFAPEELQEEVEEHLPRLAQEKGIAEDLLRQIWWDYQPYLRFCAVVPGSAAANQPVADPDDLPFLWLAVEVDARAIVSRDGDIAAMGAGVVGLEVMLHLRDYARAESIVVTIKMGGYGVTVMLTGSTHASVHLVAALVRGFARLPRWVQLALLVGTGIVALHPRSRAALAQGLHDGRIAWRVAVTRLAPLLTELVQTLGTEGSKAAAALRSAEQALPPPRRSPLETVAFAVCLAAGTPLTLAEIADRVRASGYMSRSEHFDAYLRRIVRCSPRLVRGADGRWLAAPPGRTVITDDPST